MKKTIFSLICALMLGMTLCSCGNSTAGDVAEVDSTVVDTLETTEVVDTLVADTVETDTVAMVEVVE